MTGTDAAQLETDPAKYLPDVKIVGKAEGRWSGYDAAKAEKLLGFRAQLLLRT